MNCSAVYAYTRMFSLLQYNRVTWCLGYSYYYIEKKRSIEYCECTLGARQNRLQMKLHVMEQATKRIICLSLREVKGFYGLANCKPTGQKSISRKRTELYLFDHINKANGGTIAVVTQGEQPACTVPAALLVSHSQSSGNMKEE